MAIPNKSLMIDISLRIVLLFIFFIIFWQDSKDRLVYWFLYPLAGILAYVIQSIIIDNYFLSFYNSLLNFALVSVIIVVAWIYSAAIKKRKFINESIGVGDILMFLFLCFTFTTVTFIILFVFSLIFSLVLHQYLNNKSTQATVPLAGYIALFFASVYIVSFFIQPKYLFA